MISAGGLWVALDIDVVAAQVFKGPAFFILRKFDAEHSIAYR